MLLSNNLCVNEPENFVFQCGEDVDGEGGADLQFLPIVPDICEQFLKDIFRLLLQFDPPVAGVVQSFPVCIIEGSKGSRIPFL